MATGRGRRGGFRPGVRHAGRHGGATGDGGRGGGDSRIAPERTCIGCRRTAPPDELVRVVADPGGGLAVGRYLPGRGAWLCSGSRSCLDAATRRKAFDRALRRTLDRSAVERLETMLAERGRIGG